MTIRKREHAEARAELREAAVYYEGRVDGWGEVFMDAVDNAIKSVLDPSITWGFSQGRRSEPQTYSRSVTGFPFDIIYLRDDREVYVVAYAHERKRPGYWTHRLDG